MSILIYTLRKNLIFKFEIITIICLVILALIISFLPEQKIFIYENSYETIPLGFYAQSNTLTIYGILWAIFFNLLVIIELAGIILLGYLKDDRIFINLGIFLIPIFIITKYFDWFFNFLDKSTFFITVGILILILSWPIRKFKRYLYFLSKKEEIGQNL